MEPFDRQFVESINLLRLFASIKIMNLDDPVCLCFHVSRRKVMSFIRVEKPTRGSQLSECQGAGTGCGWCRDLLERLLEESRESSAEMQSERLSAEDYAAGRARYLEETGRQPPPGVTPMEDLNDPAADRTD